MVAINEVLLIKNSLDAVVIPRASAHFAKFDGFYNEIPLEDQDLWTEDWLGLRELYERGDLHYHTSDTHHALYTEDEMRDLIVPFLQE